LDVFPIAWKMDNHLTFLWFGKNLAMGFLLADSPFFDDDHGVSMGE